MATLDVIYNGSKIVDTAEITLPVGISYNGSTIAELNSEGAKTLRCNGKLMASDVVIGDKTLQCNGNVMASDVVVSVGGVTPTIPELPPESEWVNRTFTIGEGETYQISDVGSYVFNRRYNLIMESNSTLVVKGSTTGTNKFFFEGINRFAIANGTIIFDDDCNVVMDYDSGLYSQYECNLIVNGNVLISPMPNYSLHITGDITVNGSFSMDGGTITGDITANGSLTMNYGIITGDITSNGTLNMQNGRLSGDIYIGRNTTDIIIKNMDLNANQCCVTFDEELSLADFTGNFVFNDNYYRTPDFIFYHAPWEEGMDIVQFINNGRLYLNPGSQMGIRMFFLCLVEDYAIGEITVDEEGNSYYPIIQVPQ